jgi:hypothetical protein
VLAKANALRPMNASRAGAKQMSAASSSRIIHEGGLPTL